MFLIWLCRSDTKPLFLHKRASVRPNFMPYSQTDGNLDNAQLYLIRTRSQKSCLVRSHPSFFIGKVVSQLEAPCSRFILLRRCCLSVISCRIIFKFFDDAVNFSNLILLLITIELLFGWCYLFWMIVFEVKSFDSICEKSYPLSTRSEKIGIPIPPSFGGSDISFLSIYFIYFIYFLFHTLFTVDSI